MNRFFAKISLPLKNSIFNPQKCTRHPLPSSLLSPLTYSNIVFGLSWGSFWGGVPFQYDQSQNRIWQTSSSVRKWKIVTILHSINLFYLLGVLVYLTLPRMGMGGGVGVALAATNSTSTLFDTAFAFIITMLATCLVIFNIAIGTVHRMEFCSLVNRELKYCIFLKETFANRFGRNWRNGCEEFMVAFKLLLIFPIFAALHCLQHPEKMIYMTSFLPKDSTFYGLATICNSLFVLGIQISGLGTVLGIFYPCLGFVFVFLNLLQEIKPEQKMYRTKPSFRHPKALRVLIRTMQLLGIQINVMGRHILLLEQAIMTYTGTVCIFSAIHFWPGLTISGRAILVYAALVSIGVWMTILTVAAHVYTSTERALNSWRNYSGWSREEKKEMKKYRASIRPIQLEFGGFYYIRPKKIMSFWNTLIWLIVRSLLTFPVHY